MMMRRLILSVCAAAALAAVTLSAGQAERSGVLLLAHGGATEWNERVTALAAGIGAGQPIEVAFGMASRGTMQDGIDKLVARGVTEIVVVPLFISSHSSVIRATEYLLGLRSNMPEDLKIFARMSHGHGGEHAMHEDPETIAKNLEPVVSPVPIRMTDALNHHPIVGAILADRAKAISTNPADEAVVLVAHGPVPDEDNARWLDDMRLLADEVGKSAPYASIDYLTVRDDAPDDLRKEAAEELRAVVEKRTGEKRRVLIVPLLLSYGGIEDGIRERLEGLDYVMAAQGLMPDARLTDWVRATAARPSSGTGK